MFYEIKFSEVIDIFKEFPFVLCVKEEKLIGCLEYMREQKFTKEDVLRILKRAGGILGI